MTTPQTNTRANNKQEKDSVENFVTPTTKSVARPIWEEVVEIGAQIPDEERAKLPNDASINYKHYLLPTMNTLNKQVSFPCCETVRLK